MASSSTQTTLQQLLAEIIEWIQTSDVQAFFKENEKIIPCLSMPSTISEEKQGVFAMVNWSSSFSAILFLRDHVVPSLARLHRESISLMCQNFRENDVWIGRFRVNPENYKQVVEILDSFFKELFQLPQQLQHDNEDENADEDDDDDDEEEEEEDEDADADADEDDDDDEEEDEDEDEDADEDDDDEDEDEDDEEEDEDADADDDDDDEDDDDDDENEEDEDVKLSKLRKKQFPDNVTLIKYHLPGDFLKFLEEFLKYETLQVSSFGLANVLKELKYLIPIFRDRPFLLLEYGVQCLWEQFEWLINETGRLVHFFFFHPNLKDREFCEVLTSSIYIELLKDNIIEFFRTLPGFSTFPMMVYDDVDSFVIIHSLMNDLKDLLSQCIGPIVEIKDQIRGLHQGLMLSWQLLKGYKGKWLRQIRDMAYGAEYMINSCLAGETHVWYVKLSLTTVIRDIELIGRALKEISGDWALDCSSSQTLQELLAEIIEWIQRSDAHALCEKKEKMIPCLWMSNVSEDKQEDISKVNCPGSFSAILFLRDHVVPRMGHVHQELISVICRRFRQNHVSLRRFRFNPQNYKQVVVILESFFTELFQLPKFQHEDVDTLIKYHLPEDFMKFLGEFLKYKRLKEDEADDDEDEDEDADDDEEDEDEADDFHYVDVHDTRMKFHGEFLKYETLQVSHFGLDNVLKELKYLIPIFRDRPFQALNYKVQCLWEHFEWLINKAGWFVHSLCFYSSLRDRKFCEALLISIELLKGNIIEFFTTLPNLSTSMVVYHDVDSFFIIHSLLNDLEDLLSQSDGPIVDIKDQIGGLHQGLKLSWSLLKEHIEVQEFKEVAVQVRDMAYGAEYMINSCLAGATHVWYVKLSLNSVVHHIELIGYQLLEMKEGMNERSDDCALRSVSNTFADKLSTHDRSSGTEVNDIIVGFEEEEQSILEQLLGGTQNLQKVGIVGMPGLGKTTLAKKLHKQCAVYERFDRWSWCVVSQRYQRKKLLVDILHGLGKEVKPNMDEANLELQIYQTLKGWRYLITLDDIWDLDAWGDLWSCLPNDKNRSRILFTSRNERAAPSGSIIKPLPFLSNDQCWELIRKRVFQGETCPPMLEEIGKEISAICKGLPLVVTVISGILSTEDKKCIEDKELVAWKNVMQDLKLRDILDRDEKVLQTLELSYKHLLQHLKPCFLYFALFREDKKISTKKLKQLWVAEGFIEEDEEKKKGVESIAEEYLMELINKSLVMVVERGSDGKVKTCGMHDLLHSMCIRIAEEEKFLKRVDSYSSLEYLKFNRLRLAHRECLQLGSRLRSIFSDDMGLLSFVDQTSLRVLDDPNYQKGYDADSYVYRTLVSLRYLTIGNRVKSIGSFLKLEYLILHYSIVPIPSGIRKLPKLRYLKAKRVEVDDDCEISELPNNLEYLSDLCISDLKFIQLLKSTPLQEVWKLRRLKINVSYIKCSLDLDLSFLSQLESLSIHHSMSRVLKFGKGIKFPDSIQKLSIHGVGSPWTNMSMIGSLPNLEVLKLRIKACRGDTWNTSDSGFRKLRFLKLQQLELREWNVSSSECFPCLQQIVLDRLYCLEKIPKEIGEIQTLQLIKLSQCRMSVVESAKEIEREQHEYGNDDFRVIIANYMIEILKRRNED